jgi:hypothetical protein
MTDREKVEKLAKWMGYEIRGWSDADGLTIGTSHVTRSLFRPQDCIVDAMELFEHCLHQGVWISIEGTPALDVPPWQCRIEVDDYTEFLEKGDTIAEAICNAVLAWINAAWCLEKEE